MKVLITSIPGYGHLCPLIPLAKSIHERGHQAVIGTSAAFTQELQRAGVSIYPVGPHWQESDFFFGNLETSGSDGCGISLGKYLETVVTPKMIEDVDAYVRRERPDIILSNDCEWAGRIVAQMHNIPFVLASSGPRMSREFRALFHGPGLRKIGLPGPYGASVGADYALKWLHLCFTPLSYFFCAGNFTEHQESANEYGICPAIADYFIESPPMKHITSRRDKPVLLCTLGTVYNKNAALLRTIILGLHEQASRLIVLLGGAASDGLEKLSPVVEVVTRGSLSKLVAEADYCITHGGTSTLMTILSQAKPTLLLPQGADQVINAITCNQHKLAATRMSAEPLNSSGPGGSFTLTPDLVADGFSELSSSSIFSSNVQHFSHQLAQLPPLSRAVDLIEILARTRAPVLKHG